MRLFRRNRSNLDEAPEARRITLPRRRSFRVAWDALLAIMAILLASTAWLLNNFNILPADALTLFPMVAAAITLLWALLSLIRRASKSLLFSTALLGATISLLLSTQGIAPLDNTLIGMMLLSLGGGLILRGLLMPNQPL